MKRRHKPPHPIQLEAASGEGVEDLAQDIDQAGQGTRLVAGSGVAPKCLGQTNGKRVYVFRGSPDNGTRLRLRGIVQECLCVCCCRGLTSASSYF